MSFLDGVLVAKIKEESRAWGYRRPKCLREIYFRVYSVFLSFIPNLLHLFSFCGLGQTFPYFNN